MVTLSDAGWSAPRIAAHLGYCGQTVRDLLRDFLARGTDALYPRRTGPAPDVARRDRVADELRRSARPRTAPGPAGSSAEALAERGIALGPRQVRRHLKRLKAGYRRTASTLKHKQDPAKAERAGRVLANLKAKAAAGRAGAVLPRRVRLLADAAGRLQLVAAGAAEAGPLRGPAGAAGQRPGRLSPLRPVAPAGGRSRPSGPGTRTTCWAS